MSDFKNSERTNFANLSRLIVDGGRSALQKVFDRIHPPGTLKTAFNTNVAVLKQLLVKKVLFQPEWNLLFPSNKSVPKSANFDITLLFVLLRNICGLRPPASGWDSDPPKCDESLEANLIRIKRFRNKLAHATSTKIDETSFNTYWEELSHTLVQLGLDEEEIDTLRVGSLDDLLFKWKCADDELKKKIEEIRQNQVHLLDVVTQGQFSKKKTIGNMKFCQDEAHILGKGCRGTEVYSGILLPSEEPIAVKRMYSGIFNIDEALKLRAMDHPNIIKCLAVEKNDVFIYLGLQLCTKTLRRCVEMNEFGIQCSPVDRLGCLRNVSEAVEYLHERNIRHRDIKPDNILLSSTSPPHFVLADFNLARESSANESTQFGSIVGTYGYMAPEVYNLCERTTVKTDIFSLGCVFYYVLTDKGHPFGSVECIKRCQANINKRKKPSLCENVFIECAWMKPLIEHMISFEVMQRPTAAEVVNSIKEPPLPSVHTDQHSFNSVFKDSGCTASTPEMATATTSGGEFSLSSVKACDKTSTPGTLTPSGVYSGFRPSKERCSTAKAMSISLTAKTPSGCTERETSSPSVPVPRPMTACAAPLPESCWSSSVSCDKTSSESTEKSSRARTSGETLPAPLPSGVRPMTTSAALSSSMFRPVIVGSGTRKMTANDATQSESSTRSGSSASTTRLSRPVTAPAGSSRSKLSNVGSGIEKVTSNQSTKEVQSRTHSADGNPTSTLVTSSSAPTTGSGSSTLASSSDHTTGGNLATTLPSTKTAPRCSTVSAADLQSSSLSTRKPSSACSSSEPYADADSIVNFMVTSPAPYFKITPNISSAVTSGSSLSVNGVMTEMTPSEPVPPTSSSSIYDMPTTSSTTENLLPSVSNPVAMTNDGVSLPLSKASNSSYTGLTSAESALTSTPVPETSLQRPSTSGPSGNNRCTEFPTSCSELTGNINSRWSKTRERTSSIGEITDISHATKDRSHLMRSNSYAGTGDVVRKTPLSLLRRSNVKANDSPATCKILTTEKTALQYSRHFKDLTTTAPVSSPSLESDIGDCALTKHLKSMMPSEESPSSVVTSEDPSPAGRKRSFLMGDLNMTTTNVERACDFGRRMSISSSESAATMHDKLSSSSVPSSGSTTEHVTSMMPSQKSSVESIACVASEDSCPWPKLSETNEAVEVAPATVTKSDFPSVCSSSTATVDINLTSSETGTNTNGAISNLSQARNRTSFVGKVTKSTRPMSATSQGNKCSSRPRPSSATCTFGEKPHNLLKSIPSLGSGNVKPSGCTTENSPTESRPSSDISITDARSASTNSVESRVSVYEAPLPLSFPVAAEYKTSEIPAIKGLSITFSYACAGRKRSSSMGDLTMTTTSLESDIGDCLATKNLTLMMPSKESPSSVVAGKDPSPAGRKRSFLMGDLTMTTTKMEGACDLGRQMSISSSESAVTVHDISLSSSLPSSDGSMTEHVTSMMPPQESSLESIAYVASEDSCPRLKMSETNDAVEVGPTTVTEPDVPCVSGTVTSSLPSFGVFCNVPQTQDRSSSTGELTETIRLISDTGQATTLSETNDTAESISSAITDADTSSAGALGTVSSASLRSSINGSEANYLLPSVPVSTEAVEASGSSKRPIASLSSSIPPYEHGQSPMLSTKVKSSYGSIPSTARNLECGSMIDTMQISLLKQSNMQDGKREFSDELPPKTKITHPLSYSKHCSDFTMKSSSTSQLSNVAGYSKLQRRAASAGASVLCGNCASAVSPKRPVTATGSQRSDSSDCPKLSKTLSGNKGSASRTSSTPRSAYEDLKSEHKSRPRPCPRSLSAGSTTRNPAGIASKSTQSSRSGSSSKNLSNEQSFSGQRNPRLAVSDEGCSHWCELSESDRHRRMQSPTFMTTLENPRLPFIRHGNLAYQKQTSQKSRICLIL